MITLEPPRGLAAQQSPWRTLGLSQSGLTRFLHTAQRAVGLEGEVQVLLTGDATLRRLNRTFRGVDKPTDVLSFGVDEDNDPLGPRELGDIVICPEHTEDLREAIVHGTLHLTGMDHEVDDGEMLALQAELMRWVR